MQLLTEKDRKIILSYLEKNHIETTFLIGNVNQFSIENNKDIRRCADYYGFFNNGELKGILPFYNLGSCIPHYEDEEAVPYFVDLMKEKDFEVLLGMKRIIKPIYEKIKHFKSGKIKECSYYINENFKPFIINDVIFKDAVVENSIIDFIQEAYAVGFNNKKSKKDIISMIKEKGSEDDFIIMQKDNKIVSQACIQTSTDKINQIGGVFTVADERGKGYCKAVVSELCRRIIKRGKTPTLMVVKNNTPAVKAYNKLGFKYFDDYLIISYDLKK